MGIQTNIIPKVYSGDGSTIEIDRTTIGVKDGGIDNDQLADSSVDSDKIEDGTVDTADVSTGAITLAKIDGGLLGLILGV